MEYIKIPNIYVRETYGKNKLIEGEFTFAELEYLSKLDWIWTEKVDGTNIRVIWDGYRVSFKGRTDRADIPKPLFEKLEELFGGESKEELFEEMFQSKPTILFGEGYGGKIQGNNGYGDVDFILFDAVVNGYWLDLSNIQDIVKRMNIRYVPVVGLRPLTDAVEFIRKHPMSQLRDRELEGIVCRPYVPMYYRDGNPIRVKIKCRDFSEAKE